MGRGRNRGRRKRKEAQQVETAKRDLSDEQLSATLAEIESGSDRVAAIMCAALMENSLIGAMLTCLKDAADSEKLFDDVRGPYSTMYGKIMAARAMGLFNAKVEEILHQIRKIRNKFAHSVLSLDFTDKEVAGWCEKLKPFEDKEPHEKRAKFSDARRYYEDACMHFTVHLIAAGTRNIHERVEHLKNKQLAEWFERNRDILIRPTKLNDFLGLIPPGFKGSDKDVSGRLAVIAGGAHDDAPSTSDNHRGS